MHFVFLPGKDTEYATRLKTLFDAMKLENVTVLDYVDDMAALMHGCDLAILKSGGLTVTECLCAHLPMILLGKSYGQEKANTTMLTGMGASMHVTTARELIVTLRHLHNHPESLKALLINGEVLRRPRAAEDIAIATMELAGKPQKRKRASAASTGAENLRISASRKFAARREPPIYHSMLKHSRGALASLPPTSHTYHSMLKHSRFASLAAKLRVERYV